MKKRIITAITLLFLFSPIHADEPVILEEILPQAEQVPLEEAVPQIETVVLEESTSLEEAVPLDEAFIVDPYLDYDIPEFLKLLLDGNNLSEINTSNINLENGDTKESESAIKELPNSILNETNRNHPLVIKHREQYLSEKWLKWLRQVLEDSMEYRLYVRKVIEEMGLPPELEYLPVVESNYKTTAKSKSGALGMWQFMENSVKPFLQLDEFVDERLDPWKSTQGGLRKLQDNFNQFKDWYLAIAAYNCGAGAMRKAINKAGQSDFFYIADNALISSQTVNYVPKLLAISDICEHADFYGVDLPMHEEEYKNLVNERDGIFDYVEVTKAYSLSALASEMRIDEKTIRHLNPSFTKGFTHPSKKSQIRLPVGTMETALTALENINPITFPFQYKVEKGDSLWSISRKYGVTVKTLCEVNGIEENAILRIGKILYIPEK